MKKGSVEQVKLALELADFIKRKGDISRHVSYNAFMAEDTNPRSLARDIQNAEHLRIAYEAAAYDIVECAERIRELAKKK